MVKGENVKVKWRQDRQETGESTVLKPMLFSTCFFILKLSKLYTSTYKIELKLYTTVISWIQNEILFGVPYIQDLINPIK